MDFTLSPEQRMTADVVQDLLARECTDADRRALLDRRAPRDEDRWRKLSDLALMGALVPERAGGLGLGACDFVLVAEACGRALLPEPVVDQVGVAAPLLAEFAHDPMAAPWLGRVLTGEAAVGAGHPINPFVANADSSDVLLLSYGDETHLVERAETTLRRIPSVDPFHRLFAVDWTPSDRTRLATGASGAWDRALERGALFAAAQCAGLADGAIALAVAYARERVQFGKPIGSFQAVKHLLASAQVQLEFARPVIHAAAAQIGQDNVFSRARVSHAKLQAADAARAAARASIQVHGAMGVSWEVDAHFFLKRSIALAGAWGDLSFHRKRVSERLFNADLGPEFTFGREARHD